VQFIHEMAMTGQSTDVEAGRASSACTAETPVLVHASKNTKGNHADDDLHTLPAVVKVPCSDTRASSAFTEDLHTKNPALSDSAPRCSGMVATKQPREAVTLTEDVSKVSLGECSKIDSHLPADMGTHLIQLYADIYPGGAGSLMRRLGECTESEISQVVANNACESNATPDVLAHVPAFDTSKSSARVRALVFLMSGLLKMAEVVVDVGDLARVLVICILKGSQLPTDLRSMVRPLVDLALCRSLLHHVATALWVSTTGSRSFRLEPGADGGLLSQMESEAVYAAGCLACEIEEALDEKREGDSGVIQTMRTLQWAARLHLQWLRATPSVAEQSLCRLVDLAKTGTPGGRSGERSLHDVGRKGLTHDVSAPSPSSSRATVFSESEDHIEGAPALDHSDSESTAGSADDGVSDLEDFIDFTPENNSYGLVNPESLKQAQAEVLASSSQPSPAEKPRSSMAQQVQTFCQSQLIPNWRLHCSDLLKDALKKSAGRGSSRRSRSKSPAPLGGGPGALVGKRARVSFV